MQKSKKHLLGVIYLSLALLLIACTKPTQQAKKITPKTDPQKTAQRSSQPNLIMKSHMIKAQEQKVLLKQVEEDLKIIMDSNEESKLGEALTGAALRLTLEQISKDKEAGRQKVRRYDSIKLKFANYTKGVAGLTLTFLDKSYYISLKTGKPLTKPSNKPTKILVAVKKEDKRWKIFNVLSPQVKSVNQR